ncbi:MAG: hypothetical protein HKM07_04760 [Chlamydiae bacterium]|nr:hypothetical protein [Chlamydiota bacterium]
MAGFNNGFLLSDNFSFFAYQSTSQSAITGGGSTATLICDTEIFDPFSGYNPSTGLYTIPSVFPIGTWFFQGKVTITGITTSHTTAIFSITNVNRNLYYEINAANSRTSDNELTLQVCGFINGIGPGSVINPQIQVLGGSNVIGTKATGDQWCDFGGIFIKPSS